MQRGKRKGGQGREEGGTREVGRGEGGTRGVGRGEGGTRGVGRREGGTREVGGEGGGRGNGGEGGGGYELACLRAFVRQRGQEVRMLTKEKTTVCRKTMIIAIILTERENEVKEKSEMKGKRMKKKIKIGKKLKENERV